ncbi:MAG: beta strand repeat-containing protein, partial [Blastocatellia bacterium]
FGCPGSRNYTLVVNCQGITVNPATIPTGTISTAYSQTFTHAGGVGTTTFALTGTLPTGITFSGATLSGTPTQSGSFPVTVTATDSNGCTGSRNYTLVIGCQSLAVNPAAIPPGTVNTAYSQTFTQTGGIGTTTFSLTGTLPTGIIFSGATLSGTPTQSGSFPVTVTVTDSNNCTGSRNYTLVINCQTISILPATIPAGTAGTAYSQTFTANGAIGTVTFNQNGKLPAGITFTGATLSGTPTLTGSFPISITATDANNCSTTRNYTLVINCQTISISPTTLSAGTVGTAYSQNFTQTGGIGSITFSQSGKLPAGMTFSGSALSGTPTQTGNYPITITATDSNGCSVTRNYTLIVNCQTITVNPATIPAGTVNTAYSQTFTQSDGIGTVNFSLAGALPSGLSFSGATLSGMPTQTGTFPITVTATDANGCTGNRNYTLIVNCQGFTINPAALPAGTLGTAYNLTLTHTGGIGAASYNLTGTLPNGITFTGATFSGTPTQLGSFPVTVTATDSNGCTSSRNYTLVINCQTITVNPTTIPAGTAAAAYSQSFTQVGGVGTTGFSLTGALPTGLTFSGATLSGTPTQTGSFPVTVTATDSNGCTGSDNYTLVINCQTITVNPTTIPAGTAAAAYSQSFTQIGGIGTTTFSLTGTLPAGITFVAGVLSGTPTQTGNFPIAVIATDSNGCTGIRNYTLVINCPAITANPATLPNGFVGISYGNQTLSATGGIAPYTFTVSAGALPGGLTISGSTLSGTPTAGGTFNFTLQAADGNGCAGTRSYTVIISGGAKGTSLQFYPLAAPVRLVDTRPGQTGCFTPGAQIPGGTSRTQQAAGSCSIPASAQAVIGNITT